MSAEGPFNLFAGANAGFKSPTGSGNGNSFFGVNSGEFNTNGSHNSFFGASSGDGNAIGGSLTLIGYNADVKCTNCSLDNSSAIGANAQVTRSNALVLGSINGINGATADTLVGIDTTEPNAKLQVAGGDLISRNVR